MAGELKRYLELLSPRVVEDAVEGILLREANFLYSCLDSTVAQFYTNYTPHIYARTWKFRDSIRIDRDMQRENGGYSMRVYFDEEASTHPSLFGSGHDAGFVPILWNQGWAWNDAKRINSDPLRFKHFPNGANQGDYAGNDALRGSERYRFVESAIFRYFHERGPKALPILKVVTYGGTEYERTAFNP